MTKLNFEQRRVAIEAMREYLIAVGENGQSPLERHTERDGQRERIIDTELKPLLGEYFADRLPLAEFKSTVDGINKRNNNWGFSGIKGQMFFNMVVNVAADEQECNGEIKSALAEPTNEETAKSRIRTFYSYVRRLGDEYVEAGGTKQGRPKLGSVPFFLSYFWQVQDRRKWPVYYTNSVKTMVDMNLWLPVGDSAEDYITYKQIHEELAEVMTQESGQQFGLYEVEHVFWFKGGDPYRAAKAAKEARKGDGDVGPELIPRTEKSELPESYVPPIVAVLPLMALHDGDLAQAAKASGTSLERAFEKHIDAAFTILGYETKLLGQGHGRVPDGLAQDVDDSYVILWDAKVRGDGYSMGTDDRTIREYITTMSREMKRRRTFRNVYYAIVSSTFKDDYDDPIAILKMETDVNEVTLVEAAALVEMVDAKLRDPHQVTLGPDGLQRLFSRGGVLTAEDVRETLG